MEKNAISKENNTKIVFKKFPKHYSKIEKIYQKCIHENIEERPTIENLIRMFYFEILQNEHVNQGIEKELVEILENNIKDQLDNIDGLFTIGSIYFLGGYIDKDINKAIKYWELAADKNHLDALNNLGCLYNEGKYVSRDEEKSLEYINKANKYLFDNVKNNDRNALEFIKKNYLKDDIDDIEELKKVFYQLFKLNQQNPSLYNYVNDLWERAQNNDINALYEFGMLCYEGRDIPYNINKALEYISKAANYNHVDAQMFLSKYYLDNKDIGRTIYYLTLAANQNNSNAQFLLALIYYQGKFQDIGKVIHYLTLSAKQNNGYAQYNLGILYYKGIYINRNIDLAIYYLKLAEQNNHPYASHALGTIFHEGKYVQQDIEKSIYYLTKSANNGDSEAQNHLGLIYSTMKNYINIDKAIKYFNLAIQKNNLNALNNLAELYYEGHYIPKDEKRALGYWLKAADKNDPNALFNISMYYHNNNDNEKEIKYLKLASENKHSIAQNNLGMNYIKGIIVERNVNIGLFYLLSSAEQNNLFALNNLGSIYINGFYVQRNIKKAINYLEKAANQNLAIAQFNLAEIYFNHEYGQFNISRALNYYRLSSENNYHDSTFNLAMIYYEGKYVERNISDCISFLKGIAFIHKYTKNNLGVFYKNGDGVEKDVSSAIKYFEESIKEHNDKLSMFNLAHIYLYGESGNPELDTAMQYSIKLSAEDKYLSEFLMSLVIIKKIEKNGYKKFEEELKKMNDSDQEYVKKIYEKVKFREFYYYYLFDELKKVDLIYTHSNGEYVSRKDFIHKTTIKYEQENINSQFYDGFDTK